MIKLNYNFKLHGTIDRKIYERYHLFWHDYNIIPMDNNMFLNVKIGITMC